MKNKNQHDSGKKQILSPSAPQKSAESSDAKPPLETALEAVGRMKCEK